jgi:hypothetical protein
MPGDSPFTPLFLGVKLIDIGLVTTYYFIIGIVFAKLFDSFYGKFDEENYKDISNLKLLGEIILHLFILGIVAYILRNIVQSIPFPLEGIAGFKHERLKELEGGHILAFVLILFQRNLFDKLKFFANRAFGIKIKAGGD